MKSSLPVLAGVLLSFAVPQVCAQSPLARALGATIPPEVGEGFFLPTPEGWGRERYDFPLRFAPSIPYRGHVELRAMPEMEDPGSEQHWSYVLLWWLEGTVRAEEASLRRNLAAYFHGLGRAAARGRSVPAPRVHVAEARSIRGQRLFGTVEATDPRPGKRRGQLHFRLDVRECPEQKRTAWVFRISPRSGGQAPWRELAAVAERFTCGGPATRGPSRD